MLQMNIEARSARNLNFCCAIRTNRGRSVGCSLGLSKGVLLCALKKCYNNHTEKKIWKVIQHNVNSMWWDQRIFLHFKSIFLNSLKFLKMKIYSFIIRKMKKPLINKETNLMESKESSAFPGSSETWESRLGSLLSCPSFQIDLF